MGWFWIRSAFVVTAVFTASAVSAQEVKIAGVKPFERPADAPVITEMDKNRAWFDRALSGVDAPYPYSLRFLEDQGNWFTPFTQPGMTGPYDIRGWH